MDVKSTATGSTRFPLSDLAVSGLKFYLANQAADRAEMTFRHDWKGAFPAQFPIDAEVCFYDGDTINFRGWVKKPVRKATGTSRSKTVVVTGPWGMFETTMFRSNYPYMTGPVDSTHCVLGGNANDLLRAILEMNVSDLVNIGTIDVGNIIIPPTDVYDQTVAQAIKAILRFIPGAIAAFDYSTGSKSTIHIVADNSSSLVSVPINVSAGSSSNVLIVPRYDRLISGVVLQYEASYLRKEGNLILAQDGSGSQNNTAGSPVQKEAGFYIAATDAAGDFSSRRLFRRTLRLAGAFETTTYWWPGLLWRSAACGSLAGVLYPASGIGGPGAWKWKLWALGGFFRLFGNSSRLNVNANDYAYYAAENASFGSVSLVSQSNQSTGTPSIQNLQPVLKLGQNFYSTPDVMAPVQNPGLRLSEVPTSAFFSGSPAIRASAVSVRWSNFFQLSDPSGYKTFNAENILFLDNRDVGVVDSNGMFSFTKTVSTSNVDIPASGVAAQLLAANSRLLHDGQLTLKCEFPLAIFGGVRRRVVLSPEAVSTPIQTIAVDWFRKTVSIDFGAPEHLGPQDLITLIRAGNAI